MAFGQELQLERERRAISLASIAEATKVPQRHLLALELGDFQQLPGGIFARSIVRSYCRHVGLEEEPWLRRLPVRSDEETSPEWTEFAENVRRSRVTGVHPMRWRWWGVLLMASALVALSWVAWRYVVQPQLLDTATGATASRGVEPPAHNFR